MKLGIKSHIIVLIFLIFISCQASHIPTPLALTPVPAEAHFPTTDVPLPFTDFKFFFPITEELADMPTPRKEITASFSSREINELAVSDPKRFQQGNTEIIDLSLIAQENYAFPLPGGKVISPYGGRRRHHSGTDIKTYANDTIVAAFDGIVRMAKPYAAYGNVIVIRHYNGLETIYSHNSKNLVKPGDIVSAGDPIGLTGRTGRATTEHLHFEVRINGQHFNPNLIFNMQERRLQHKYLVCTKKGNHISVNAVNVLPHQRLGSYNRFAQTKSR